MKFTITLHPVSLAVGAAALGGVLWLASAVQAPASHAAAGQVPVTLGAPIEVKGIPTPRQIVRLSDGDFPYTVPPNRAFVITACVPRANTPPPYCNLLIGGQQVAFIFIDTNGGSGGLHTTRFGSGLVAKSGETVTLTYAGSGTGTTNATLIGYLSD
jgi:hypothetical protein